MENRGTVWTIVVVLVLAVLGYWWYASRPEESAVPNFTTEEAGAVQGAEAEAEFDLENLSK